MYVDDIERVHHMIEAAEEALSFVQGGTIEDVRGDRKLELALTRCLEIVGEAAYKTTRDYRDAHPTVNWRELIRLRHHLIHDYAELDVEQIWSAVTSDLPAALPALRGLLPTSTP